jgi:hypothetical protein
MADPEQTTSAPDERPDVAPEWGDTGRIARANGVTLRSLLLEDALALHADSDVWPAVARWIPRIPAGTPLPGNVRAWIHAEDGDRSFDIPSEPPRIELCSVTGWPGPSGRLLLCDSDHRISAVVDPAGHQATVRLRNPREWPDRSFRELFAAFTLTASFLLGRLRRTLVHAGAVVAPDGRAWLLVGGTFSGKTTTCINLIRRGWDYVTDDQAILRREGDGISVEGWPRSFNVDVGYSRHVSEGVRSRVDPDVFGPGRWRRTALLGGLIFPRVEAGLPTVLTPMGPADALSGLLRQSPWLLADPATAPNVLTLLVQAGQMPSYRLRLGADTYQDGEHLCRVLAPAVGLADDHRPPPGDWSGT